MIMRSKCTVKVPGSTVSPISFDLNSNIYFSTDKSVYRVSPGDVEQIPNGVPFRQVSSRMLGFPDWGAYWPSLALYGNHVFIPGTDESMHSSVTLTDSGKKTLWEYNSGGHGIGVIPCCFGGCYLLSERKIVNGRQYTVEKINRLGDIEWEKKYIDQPFHIFGPPDGGYWLLFFHGNDWARDHYVMRLTQLDANGKETCIDEFTQSRTFRPLWTKGGSLLLVSIKSDAKTSLYEIRKYDQDPETGYYLSGKWFFDDMFYVGNWGVSPSGNYLCYMGGNTASIGNWSSIISLFSLTEQAYKKDVFIEQETPINLACTPHHAAPLVTDSGIVLSAWHQQKKHPIFVTDFLASGMPIHQIRNSPKTTLFMEEHDSMLYLVETMGGYIYLSTFDMPCK